LPTLLGGELTEEMLHKFTESSVHIIKNKIGRSYPRASKTPFTKWYVKSYSLLSSFKKIINAIKNKKVDGLHANLKVIAKQITEINHVKIT
jgi:hypothetical protein